MNIQSSTTPRVSRKVSNHDQEKVTWEDVHDFSHAKDVVRIGGLYTGEGGDPSFYATGKQMKGIRTIARRRNNVISAAVGLGMGVLSTIQSGQAVVGISTGLLTGALVRFVSKHATVEVGGGMYVHEAVEYVNSPLNKMLQWGQP